MTHQDNSKPQMKRTFRMSAKAQVMQPVYKKQCHRPKKGRGSYIRRKACIDQ